MPKLTNYQKTTMQLFRYHDDVTAGTGTEDFFASPQSLRALQKKGLLNVEQRQNSLGWYNWHYTLTDAGRRWLANQEAASDETHLP